MTAAAQKIRPAPVRKSVRVNAPQARAFEIFTAGIARWWPSQHTILKSPLKLTIVEPRIGGRWYQTGEDGSESDLGKVVAWEPPGKVILSWRFNSKFEFDDDVESEVEVRFFAEGANATRVELEHRIFAVDGEALRNAVDTPGGWTGIMESFARVAAE